MSKNYGNNSQLSEIVKYISDTMKFPIMGAGGGFAPIGTINYFDASIAPLGWLACDGSVVNIADYPELATFYASVHGASNFYGGNGTTTFAVPDLRGEFLRGTGTNSHTNQGSGANVGVHQDGTEHQPFYMGTSGTPLWLTGRGTARLIDQKYDSLVPNTSSNGRTNINQSGTDDYSGTGADSGNNYITSRPTNTSFLICVKATVAGDANAHQYSTEEQVVGKWIDGSDIYEKTFVGDGTLSLAKGWTNIDSYFGVTVSNLNRITRFELSGNDGTLVFNIGEMEISGNNLRVYDFTSDTVSDGVLTLLYTKTTS